jgi:hypothetical protein
MKIFIVGLAVVVAGCGGRGNNPSSPTPPAGATATLTLTFHVYNSATGEIPGAGFTKTVDVPAGTWFPTVSISLAQLPLAGVDAGRAVLRYSHVGDKIGALIAKTLNGTLTFQPTFDATYDLFLMNASAGVDYACLDYTGEAPHGASSAFPTLHRYTTATLLGCPVEDGPDEPIQLAVDQFNEALNPFGVRYGYVDYRGADGATGNMAVAWTPRSACVASKGGSGLLVVQQDPSITPTRETILVIHELGHAYLGAPDYYNNRSCFSGNLACAFLDCAPAADEATFSPAGQDAARYWALIDSRTRGASGSLR